MKLLFLCIDGMEYTYAQDISSNLGLSGHILKSLPNGLNTSGPAWTSIYTGVTPDKHGITSIWGHAFNKKSTIYNVNKQSSKGYVNLEYPCIWDYLNYYGLTCGLYGPPMTFPVRQTSNWAVAGFCRSMDANNSNLFYNVEPFSMDMDLVETYVKKVGVGELRRWGNVKDSLTFGDALKIAEEQFSYRFNYLENIAPVDCLFVSMEIFDRTCHLYGIDGNSAKPIVRLISEWSNFLIKKYNPEFIIGVSDHGTSTVVHTYDGGVFGNFNILPSSVLDVKNFILNKVIPNFEPEVQVKISRLNSELNIDVEEDKQMQAILKSLGYV